MIPYGKHEITPEDIDAVLRALKHDWLTQGKHVPEFEKKISTSVNAKFAIAVNSATSALHLSCLSLGLSEGDILWTSPISFVASSNCALYCGAKVDFVDIDPISFNICCISLEEKLLKAAVNDTLPKVVVVVHMAGQPCDMERIFTLSKRFNFSIIEDASHALGSSYNGSYTGSCKYSDLTVFSFHPVKIITTGEGGVITTNNKELARKISLLRSHGITKNSDDFISTQQQSWYYEQLMLGFNYRITDIQASLGISQLSRLREFIKKRNKIAFAYDKALDKLPLKLPVVSGNVTSSFHLYIIRVNSNLTEITRDHLFNELLKNNIGVNLHYIPIYRQPYYKKFNFNYSDFPVAEKYFSEALSIPIYPNLSAKDQEMVIKKIKQVFAK